MNTVSIFLIVLVLLGIIYGLLYKFFLFRVQREESSLVSVFLSKIAKIPSIIEVMRPYVFDKKVFDTITGLHSEAMIHRTDTIYDLLELNARIEHEFLFLMKLSVQIPELQKDEYFLYIRDFIMRYERDMRSYFSQVNMVILAWNRFVTLKNASIIWYLLPWKEKEVIH